jgi:hypothetical protein
MTDRDTDLMLGNLLRSNLALTRDREEAIWRAIVARRAENALAWSAFTTVMMLVGVALSPAARASAWMSSYSPKQ